MTQGNKSRGKKRLLLDEDELRPKTDAWDIFYGKTPSIGSKPEGANALPRERLSEDERFSAPAASGDARHEPAMADVSVLEATASLLSNNSTTSNSSNASPAKIVDPNESSRKLDSNELKPLAFKSRQNDNGKEASANPVNNTFESNPALDVEELTFEDFERAFKKLLSKADLKVCKIIFAQTYAVGKLKCIVRIDDLVAQVKTSKRHLFRVLSELENSGFIERGGIYNTPTVKGIEITFHPVPRIKKHEIIRQFHYYDK